MRHTAAGRGLGAVYAAASGGLLVRRVAGAQRCAFWSRAVDWALGRTFVGQDADGRKYYESEEERPRDGRVVRRTFTGDADTRELPVEWLAWLRHTRPHPPTPEESRQLEEARTQLKARVTELAAEEAKRRERARVLGQQRGEAAGAEQLEGGVGDTAAAAAKNGFAPSEWRP